MSRDVFRLKGSGSGVFSGHEFCVDALGCRVLCLTYIYLIGYSEEALLL